MAAACLMGSPAQAQVVVTTTADIPVDQADCATAGSDTCTLRAAIDRLNRFQVSPRRIVFNLPGPGPHVIRLEPSLGSLLWTSSGELDGLSQQGAGRRFGSDPENPVDYVLQVGIAAPLFQTIDGPLMVISGEGNLRGIAFFDHEGVGVRLERGAISNSFFNTLNGTDPGSRRLTTGVEYRATNAGTGAGIYSSLFMGPGSGITLLDARSSTSQAIAQPIVGESYFGTDRTGLLPRPLEYGVLAQIGTTPPVIFGRARPVEPVVRQSLFHTVGRNAIRLRGVRPILSGITIGYDASGTRVTATPPSTQGAGILLEGPNHAEDGDGGRIDDPRIFGQRGPGIQLDDMNGSITNVGLELASANARSTIFGNGALGISLNPSAPSTPTPNDAGDADDGPNGRQNYPVLNGLQRIVDETGEERLALNLTLQSRPNRAYELQLFANSQCDPSGHGEGEVVLANSFQENDGQLTTDANGVFSGTVTLLESVNTLLQRLDGRPYVTALVTDTIDFTTGEGHNTSEFSACLDASNLDPPGQQLGFDRREYTFREGQTASVLVQRTGGTTGEVRVTISTADGTALAGRDYEAVRRDLVFADGVSAFGVQIPLRPDDSTPQPTREFAVQLLVPTGGTGGATIDPFRAEATVRILDDDASYQVTDSVGAELDLQMDFGTLEYGESAEGTVTIRNTGEPRITFESIEFVRSPADDRFREVGRTCGQFVDAGQSCTVTIRFAPGSLPDARPISGQGELIIVPTSGASRTVAVAGTAPPRANLSVNFREVEPVNPEPGAQVRFRINAGNSGPAEADSSVLTVTLPAQLEPAAASLAPTQGTISRATSPITWEVGRLEAGAFATLELAATVDPAAARGTVLTVSASLQLTDPRRVDPSLDLNSLTTTLGIGAAAADLAVTSVVLQRGSEQINIARRCNNISAVDGTCQLDPDSQNPIDTGIVQVTVSNLGPDLPEGPVMLRIVTGLCFTAPEWRSDGGKYRAYCRGNSPFTFELDPADLVPGESLQLEYPFFAPSGPTGPERITFEIVHATFDRRSENNALLSAPVMVVIPLDENRGTVRFCFIATAAYGSWLDPHVAVLRAFRDRQLLTNAPGRAFVAWYYRVSPPLADWISTREWARAATRGALAPVVFTVEHPGLAGTMALVAFGGLWRLRTRRRGATEVTP